MPEELDLHGKLTMQAKLSQTATGFKSFLLRFADPIFSKSGKGTVLPIKITGPVQHPHYGLDLGRKAVAGEENKYSRRPGTRLFVAPAPQDRRVQKLDDEEFQEAARTFTKFVLRRN